MAPLSSNVFLHLGQQVKDEYGRPIGKITSFIVTPNGRVDEVFIEHGDSEFLRYPFDQFKIDENGVTLLSEIKTKVNMLCDGIPLIWRKDQALKSLLEKNKVSPEMYNELHRNFEGVLNQLKTEAQTIREYIDKKIAQCSEQIKELNSALINVELENEIGKLDENAYRTALEMIQEGLKWCNNEKADLEKMRNTLTNILLGETVTETPNVQEETLKEEVPVSASAADSELPEPPVVVYVKNIGRSTP
ncbi:MAG: CdvA-like protein [Candidatus Bathyarchaeia archaeon]